jgi:hypothetical protein
MKSLGVCISVVCLLTPVALAADVKDVGGESSIDAATIVDLTPSEARRLTATAGKVLSLPRVQELKEDAARVLATHRQESGTCTYTVMVPVQDTIEQKYTVMVTRPEEKTSPDGKKYTVSKCFPEERTRLVSHTKYVPEQLTHKCPLTLQLDGLSTTEPRVLAALAEHDGNLFLNGMKTLSQEQARSLAAHKGGTLALNGVSSLDMAVAEQLGVRKGDLALNGIRSLTADTARALCQASGSLSLDGLEVLTEEVAEAIATHVGSVSLQGVTTTSEKAIQAVANRPVELPKELLTAKKEKRQ